MKHITLLALMLLSVLSYAQEPQSTNTNENTTNYVENEFIIWLEQGVDASTFAINSGIEITPKRLLSERLNIWLFEILDSKGPKEDKMHRLTANADVRLIQNNHTNIVLREAIPDDPYYSLQWAPAIMSLPQAWEEFTTGGVTATGDTIVVAVIDGGTDWTHEDLNCWENSHEIPITESMTMVTAISMTITVGMLTIITAMLVVATTAPTCRVSSGRSETTGKVFAA